jgi:hypothetical protein
MQVKKVCQWSKSVLRLDSQGRGPPFGFFPWYEYKKARGVTGKGEGTNGLLTPTTACSDSSHPYSTWSLWWTSRPHVRSFRSIPSAVVNARPLPNLPSQIAWAGNRRWFCRTGTVQVQLHDTAEKSDVVQKPGHLPLVIEAVGSDRKSCGAKEMLAWPASGCGRGRYIISHGFILYLVSLTTNWLRFKDDHNVAVPFPCPRFHRTSQPRTNLIAIVNPFQARSPFHPYRIP